MIDLGTAEPLLKQLSYGRAEPHKFPLYARWRLSASATERIEQAGAGGDFMLQITVEYGLMGHLVPVPDVSSLAALNQLIAAADMVGHGRVPPGRLAPTQPGAPDAWP